MSQNSISLRSTESVSGVLDKHKLQSFIASESERNYTSRLTKDNRDTVRIKHCILKALQSLSLITTNHQVTQQILVKQQTQYNLSKWYIRAEGTG